MVITISGAPGSGKTTLRQELFKRLTFLNYQQFSASEIIRSKVPAGKNIDEFYKELENNPEVEKAMDEEQQKLVLETENIILESRVGFMLKSPFPKIDILLTVEEKTAVKRMKNRPEYQNLTEEKIAELRKERMQTEKERYKKLYNTEDHLAEDNFNVVIKTTNLYSPEEVADIAITTINRFINKHYNHGCKCRSGSGIDDCDCDCGCN